MSQSEPGAPLLVLGASGPVGTFLLDRLSEQAVTVMAVSRQQPQRADGRVIWMQLDLNHGPVEAEASVLVSLGPIRHALAQVEKGRRLGRVVALSSASTLFKTQSSDPAERELMAELLSLEQALEQACRERDIDLTLLKPTMIYGGGRDGNVSRIGALVKHLGLVPYCGKGLRQPVHADDLARVVVDCLKLGRRAAGRYLLGGGETLDYPTLLKRVGSARGQVVKLVRLPVFLLKLMLKLAHLSGRMNDVRPAMLERQAIDLVVDDQPARERLNWRPRAFRPD